MLPFRTARRMTGMLSGTITMKEIESFFKTVNILFSIRWAIACFVPHCSPDAKPARSPQGPASNQGHSGYVKLSCSEQQNELATLKTPKLVIKFIKNYQILICMMMIKNNNNYKRIQATWGDSSISSMANRHRTLTNKKLNRVINALIDLAHIQRLFYFPGGSIF